MSKGTVIKSTGSRFTVKTTDGSLVSCSIRGKFRIKGIRATNPVAVGDRVDFEAEEEPGQGIINAIEERSNYIIRRASNLSKEYQLLACNVDTAWLMISMVMPRTFPAFVDRFLVSAEAYRIPVVLLFNKTDLYDTDDEEEMEEWISMYTAIGYECLKLSLQNKSGLEEVKARMLGGINVISGNSGVGKSTLVNVLDPSFRLKTSKVSESHQTGKHTTTFAEMYELAGGIRIIDTPGIKAYGMIDIQREELSHFFPEIFRAASRCKYHNCLHLTEPECAVKEAVQNGSIRESRYFNYQVMMEEEEGKYR